MTLTKPWGDIQSADRAACRQVDRTGEEGRGSESRLGTGGGGRVKGGTPVDSR